LTTDSIVRWATARNVIVEKLSYGADSDYEIYKQYLLKFGGCVSHFQIIYPDQSNSWNSWGSVTSNKPAFPIVRDVFAHCAKLYSFQCDSTNPCSKFSTPDLKGLSCASLSVLKLLWCTSSIKPIALLNAAPNLDAFILQRNQSDWFGRQTIKVLPARLTVLSLVNVSFDADVVGLLAQQCPNIKHFSIKYERLSREVVESMKGFKNLVSLDNSDVTFAQEDTIYALADTFGDQLTELLLQQCYAYTLSFSAVLPRFTKLRTFSMTFNPDALDTFKYGFGLLTTLRVCLSTASDGDANLLLAGISEHCVSVEHLQLCLGDLNQLPLNSELLLRKCAQLRTVVMADSLFTNMFSYDENADLYRQMRPDVNFDGVYGSGLSVLRQYD